MGYYVVLLPMRDEEKSALYRPEHLAYLEEQRALGRIFANGRFTDGSGGMVIYKAESAGQAQDWAAQDPYVIHGARSAEVREWDMVPGTVSL
ncbi:MULTISPECIES: YciI family protein [Paenibacillus]|uniref:YciI family protein n=1 Tax=Paenibacillus TaxID=44249 RepID=UPI0022B8DB95|nr:YciI family protein [Paenibacillus caseinilyticus]MCZ8522603.1 YciI family protein [Paenibacillus caseinilyticus]